MKKAGIIISILLFSIACGKEKLDWEVVESGYIEFMSLELVHSNDFSEDNPYDTVPNSMFTLFSEKHEYNEGGYGLNYYRKEMIIELPGSLDDFRYDDEEIYQNLDCALWHYYGTNDDGYYRIHKGWIKGSRDDNGKWSIDFHVTYAGKNDDRYEMKRGADY